MQANSPSIHRRGGAADIEQTSSTEWATRLVGAIEVLGGLFGAGLATALFIETRHPLTILAFLIYIANVVAGTMLWSQLKAGYTLSLALQIAQVPWILTAKASYALVCGAGVWLGAGQVGFVRDHTLLSWFHFGTITGWGISTDGGPWHLGINLIAAAMAAFLISNWPSSRRPHQNFR
jgi:hypothetical protein